MKKIVFVGGRNEFEIVFKDGANIEKSIAHLHFSVCYDDEFLAHEPLLSIFLEKNGQSATFRLRPYIKRALVKKVRIFHVGKKALCRDFLF